jgi:adenylylsulfate kinase
VKHDRGLTVWLTGLPCSGKSTLAQALETWLRERSYRVEVLDGDVIRTHLSSELGFSKEDRDINVRRIGFVCQLLSRNGVIAIAAAIAPYRATREDVRKTNSPNFLEVHVDCPVDVCIQRDVKGMYKKAMAGTLAGFTGVDAVYEAPIAPELVLKTSQETPHESLSKLLATLRSHGYISHSRP